MSVVAGEGERRRPGFFLIFFPVAPPSAAVPSFIRAPPLLLLLLSHVHVCVCTLNPHRLLLYPRSSEGQPVPAGEFH